jgi:hypothetical protein
VDDGRSPVKLAVGGCVRGCEEVHRRALAHGADKRQSELRKMVSERLVRERMLAWLSGFFGALACLLAMLGLYGVISYMTARRQKKSEFAWLSDRRGAVSPNWCCGKC